jgi:hypothetical protein
MPDTLSPLPTPRCAWQISAALRCHMCHTCCMLAPITLAAQALLVCNAFHKQHRPQDSPRRAPHLLQRTTLKQVDTCAAACPLAADLALRTSHALVLQLMVRSMLLCGFLVFWFFYFKSPLHTALQPSRARRLEAFRCLHKLQQRSAPCCMRRPLPLSSLEPDYTLGLHVAGAAARRSAFAARSHSINAARTDIDTSSAALMASPMATQACEGDAAALTPKIVRTAQNVAVYQ